MRTLRTTSPGLEVHRLPASGKPPPTLNSPRVCSNRRSRSGVRGKDAGIVGQASWASSVINLVNTSAPLSPPSAYFPPAHNLAVVGAGVLAMPLAMSHMGLFLGILVIAWSGATAGFGLYLQTKCARYLERGTASFYAVSQVTYPNAAVVFDAAIALKCFGVAVSYLIIIGNLMPGVMEGLGADVGAHGFLEDRRFWITGFMWVVCANRLDGEWS